ITRRGYDRRNASHLMNLNGRFKSLERLLSIAALSWCLLVGVTLWYTPFRYLHERSDRPGVQVVYVPFSEVAGLHVLLIPMALAALAVWLSPQHQTRYLAVVTGVFACYCFVSGFSIGAAYLPAAGALVVATITSATEVKPA